MTKSVYNNLVSNGSKPLSFSGFQDYLDPKLKINPTGT